MNCFSHTRDLFELPHSLIYLNGNSLGPLPKNAMERARQTIENEWGKLLITGWNEAGWMDLPTRLGNRIGKLVGAQKDSIVVGDTLSIKVYQALACALEMRPDRRTVLSDNGNFPTDLYMADGLIKSLGNKHQLSIVAPEEVEASIDENVAVVMLTEVDYRTGKLHDMKQIIQKAHAMGALVVWDLAHSAGAIPVDLTACNADFAVGCTYKYLNGGPGAPAFIYINPQLAEQTRPALAGWLGHQAPFSFDLDYRPAPGIERMRVGTPSVIQMAILDAALDAWDNIDMADIRTRSIQLSEGFINEVENGTGQMTLASPRDPCQRGSQISFHFKQGYAAMQALIEAGIVGDFRAPDIMRFGICPLYVTMDDVIKAAQTLVEIVETSAWDQPRFKAKKAVT